MNLNDQIDWNDTDRIVSNDTRYVSLNGDWWRESSSWQTRQNGSSALTRVGLTRTRLTKRIKDMPPPQSGAVIGRGALISETHSLNPLGNATISRSYLDRSSHTTTRTATTPASSLAAETVVQSGLTLSSRSPTGVTTTYAYVALGRQVSQTDGRGNTSHLVYDAQGRVAKTIDALGHETTYAYDALGRQVAVTDPLGHTVTTTYDAEGRVTSERGATYPVDYAYDAYGNKVSMTTYRNESDVPMVGGDVPGAPHAGDTTRWFYDEPSGCMTNKVAHTGKVSGRLLADADFAYSYAGGVKLTDKAGRTASYSYDEANGIFTATDFTGRSTTTYYFMRYDAAYLGKVRKVVDGRGRDLVAFRYDKKTGKPVRVTDRLGNKRILEYDAKGNCTKLSRRADWSLSEEPVRSFAYDRKNRLSSVSELDADGKPVRTTSLSYDKQGRPTRVTDGRRAVSVAYSPSGFPLSLKDDFSSVSLAYDRYNRLVSSTDPYGVVTTRTYADHGGLKKVERKDGAVLLSSISVGYDRCGRPVSVTDQDGLTTACDRDALGRIVKEKYANDTEVAYGYDKIGRLSSVLDENGHEIKFGWDRFGLSSRLTAADQLTDMKRDANGLVTSVTASKNGKADRTIRREYDEFDRVTKVDYGNNETETFAYDKWGRLSAHTRGKLKETYAYDHFGRLAQKDENGLVYTYGYDAYGNRTSRTVRSPAGETTEERRSYDKYGRLVEIASFGTSVKYRYDAKGRITRQTVDGSLIDFAYTKYGQLAGKYLGGKEKPDASVEYEYSKSGRIVARTANGVRQTYEYDGRGQLLAVKENGVHVERYAYDKAGNMTKKALLRRGHADPTKPPTLADYVITTFAFDGANQLVSSTTDGVTTKYAYDAAGRLVKEGDKTYRYGYLDKVLSVTEGERTYTYDYHVDGQLARADYGKAGGNGGRAGCPQPAGTEDFLWDGLALIQRGDEQFVNEPHVGGGNPVASSKGTSYFNDMLGTTVGAKKDGKYSAAALTAFGEDLTVDSPTPTPTQNSNFFTGKPYVEGLGHAFWMRNYRAGLAKWQTADPLGYPDGWNQMEYCKNHVKIAVDVMGGWVESVHHDINRTWLISNAISINWYNWGTLQIDVLSQLNAASDWTDSFSGGNQDDSRAYMHAMRSDNQSVQDAEVAWMYYMSFCQRTALDFAAEARMAYRRGDYLSAQNLITEAVFHLGCLVHTFVDETAPPHHGFQHFSLWTSPYHLLQETYSVYADGNYRSSIRGRLNEWYLVTLREVLKQPE